LQGGIESEGQPARRSVIERTSSSPALATRRM
jgi:hypothetical protein